MERLAVLYVHNASSLVYHMYKLISNFIDPVTREKIVFLPPDQEAAAAILAKDVPLEVRRRGVGILCCCCYCCF